MGVSPSGRLHVLVSSHFAVSRILGVGLGLGLGVRVRIRVRLKTKG